MMIKLLLYQSQTPCAKHATQYSARQKRAKNAPHMHEWEPRVWVWRGRRHFVFRARVSAIFKLAML